MVLIPFPKKIANKAGAFCIAVNTRILLDASCEYTDFEAALSLKEEIHKMIGVRTDILKGFYEQQDFMTECDGAECVNAKGLIIIKRINDNTKAPSYYKLDIDEHLIEVTGNSGAALFYGIQTLRQLIRSCRSLIPCLEIEDYPDFKNRGLYHDITRGKVPSLDTLKELVDRLSFYKMNQLQLYIEHSFAFKKQSEIWTDSDPITAEEILILDEYCRKKNVELVPSMSSFGHLYHLLISKAYSHLNEFESIPEKPFMWTDRMQHYTIDVSNPLSQKLIKEMVDEYLPLFTSDKFNICCDETFDLGQGRNKKLADEVGKGKLYQYFAKIIIEHVKSYGKKVMIWGDIILNHPEIIEELPDDIILLNWDYSPDADEAGFRVIEEAGLTQYACPGVLGWNGLISNMDVADKNISIMVSHAKKYNADGILVTDWGDFGHINLLSASIPGAILSAGLSWNADEAVKPADEDISRVEFGDNSGRIVGLIRELSRQSMLEWDAIVLWYYSVMGMDVVASYNYENGHIPKLLEYEESKIKDSYNRIIGLAGELSALYSDVFSDKKKDIKEYIISANGIALFQALLLVIKKKFFGQSDIELIFSPGELANRLELWFAEYKIAWRARNKESELFRIKDVIMGICKLLRS